MRFRNGKKAPLSKNNNVRTPAPKRTSAASDAETLPLPSTLERLLCAPPSLPLSSTGNRATEMRSRLAQANSTAVLQGALDGAEAVELLGEREAAAAAVCMATRTRNRRPRHPTGEDSADFRESLRINDRILHAHSVANLHAVVQEELEAMLACPLGTVNISTVMLHAARLMGRQAASASRQRGRRARGRADAVEHNSDAPEEERQALQSLLSLMRTPALEALRDAKLASPWDIAITMYAYARMQHYDAEVIGTLLIRVTSTLPVASPLDVVHVLWACARLGHVMDTHETQMLGDAAVRMGCAFKPGELSIAVWALARQRLRHISLLEAVCARVVYDPTGFASQELVRVLVACAHLSFYPARFGGVCAVAARELLLPPRHLNPQDLSNALWALGRLQCSLDGMVLQTLGTLALDAATQMRPEELASTAWGLAKLRGPDNAAVVAQLADTALPRLAAMRTQELCMVLWAMAAAQVKVSKDSEMLACMMEELVSRLDCMPPISLSLATKCLIKLGCTPSADFLRAVCDYSLAQLWDFKVMELSNLLWAFSQAAWKDAVLCEESERFMCDNIHRCTQTQVTSVVASMKAMGHQPDELVALARNYDLHA